MQQACFATSAKYEIALGFDHNVVWNPATEVQTTDRAYHIGRDTVEQRTHQMQQQKAQLAAGLLADADISNKLSPEMVKALLQESRGCRSCC